MLTVRDSTFTILKHSIENAVNIDLATQSSGLNQSHNVHTGKLNVLDGPL